MTRSKAAILGAAILVLAVFSLAGGALGTVVPPPSGGTPVILAVSPTSGPSCGYNEVVIEGSGFTGTGEYALLESSDGTVTEDDPATAIDVLGND